MKIFLISESFISIRENDVKIATVIDKANSFLKNLQKSIQKFDNFVFICNDPVQFEQNDISADFIAKAFKAQLKEFKNVIVLDNRTRQDAKNILQNADFVYLQGGKIPVQNKFLKEINFEKNINSDATIVGKSAGAMNLCEQVYNYPEEDNEVGGQKWYDGIGLCKYIIIPHFNLQNGNEFCFGNFNLLKDYYLPQSMSKKLYALTNGAYILIEDNAIVYGESYVIQNGKIEKICKNNQFKILN